MESKMPHHIHPSSKLAAEFWAKGRSESCPVIDIHAHMGPFYGIHFPLDSPETLVKHMDRTGVRMTCFAHHDAITTPDIGNKTALEAVLAFPDRLRAYLTINPNYPDDMNAEIKLMEQYPDVFIGFKLHPGMHNIALENEAYNKPMAIANERRRPVLIHTWGHSATCGAAQIRVLSARYPNAMLILGHALWGDWDGACAVAKECQNTFLELTAVVGKRGAVEKLTTEVGSDRILFGTDLPWFDEHFYIGNILCANISETDKYNILCRNAEKILSLI